MVDDASYEFGPDLVERAACLRPATPSGTVVPASPRNRTHRRRVIDVGLVGLVTLVAAAAVAVGVQGGPRIRSTSPAQTAKAMHVINPWPALLMALATSTTAAPKLSAAVPAPKPAVPKTATTVRVPAPKTATTKPVAPPKTATAVPAHSPTVIAPFSEPPVATLVAEVEAAGIQPGSNWSWSMGDTATHCGVIPGTSTGCTFGGDGLEHTVFGGSPTLALVAHELANAEALRDAVPSLMKHVSTAESGTSWSPTDALATCLVAHFMGFQDAAAGTWRCPGPLGNFVAQNIHDTAP
jgi:hypothetical protein